MSLDALGASAGAVLLVTIARTIMAMFISIRNHANGDPVGPSPALQSLADGILAMGAVVYASGGASPDTPRTLMAALLVYAVAWQAYAAVRHAQGHIMASDSSSIVDGFLTFLGGWSWFFVTLMLAFLSGHVVATRPEMTDSQKLAPLVGICVPLGVGLLVGAFMESREREPSVVTDVVVAIMSAGVLAFGWWAWL